MKNETKSGVAGAVAALLSRIQSRLDKVGRETRQNTDAIVQLQVSAVSPSQVLSVAEKVSSIERVAEKREAQQTLRDQNNVQSLVNLRDSTSKAFSGVQADMQSVAQQLQRFNERIGRAESRLDIFAQQAISAAAFKQAQSQATGMPSDHVWVNKKLTGVYDTTDDLETRVKKLENLLRLYETLRLAQVALAEANGIFLAGPKA